MKRIILAALLFALSLPAQAFELSLVGAANFSTPSLQVNGVPSTGYSSKLALGGGLLLGFDLDYALELEIGALYVGRNYTYPIASGQAEDSFYNYEIPVILRLIPLKYVTLGGGAYYALPTGNDTYTVTPAGGSGTSSTSLASNSFKGDVGVVASLGIKIPFGVASAILLDGRYYYGLTNASKLPGETLKFRDTQAIFGFNFGF